MAVIAEAREAEIEAVKHSSPQSLPSAWPAEGVRYAVYAFALAVAVSTWFVAVRSPLWLDETGSWWDIAGGFSQIWSRQTLWFPLYAYILWLSSKILGASEIALRIPSVLAMLGAVWLLYRAARELFNREAAILASVLFALHSIVIYAAIDVRPYAFAVLATNAAILVLVRLSRSDSGWMAAFFGILAASILYFQYLFASILPAFVIGFFILKGRNWKTTWRQFAIAAAAFASAFVPLIPGVRDLFQTSGTHVFETAPEFVELFRTLAPDWLPVIFGAVAFLAFLVYAAAPKLRNPAEPFRARNAVFCLLLALIPLLILYGVSVGTPIHLFVRRHRVIAVPGIALCWGFLVSRFRVPALRVVFCIGLVGITAGQLIRSAGARHHDFTEKYALAFVERKASPDNAPVLVCSNFPEADYAAMPTGPVTESRFFAPLSYYRVTVPVEPLPRALNDEAIRDASRFLQQATLAHQHFFALGDKPSWKTLDFLAHQASGSFEVSDDGIFDEVKVLEFRPKAPVASMN